MSEDPRFAIARIEAEMTALWTKTAPEVLRAAFEPLGVDVVPWSPDGNEIFKLSVSGKGVGTAFLFSPTKIVVVGLRETEHIQLGRWRTHQFPLRSPADLYDRLTAWLCSALTKKKVPVQHAKPGEKHRDLLCVTPQSGHSVKYTPHSFVSSDQKRETWRCQECGHDTSIPSSSS